MARKARKQQKKKTSAPRRLSVWETGIDGAQLVAARDRKGLSQEQLAVAIGYTAGNLSKLERMQMGCRTNVLRRICIVLGESSDVLLGLK